MNSLNSILLEGVLKEDPIKKDLPEGSSVCEFTIASDRFYKQNDELKKEVSYFEVETWSKIAETCLKTLKKGRVVRMVGRLKQDRWTDVDGIERSKVKIVAEHVEFKPVLQETQEEGE